MNIVLELKGKLKEFWHQPDIAKNIKLCITSDSKVSDIIKQLNITIEYIALVTVNNKLSDFDYILKDGDKVVFYPPIGGG